MSLDMYLHAGITCDHCNALVSTPGAVVWSHSGLTHNLNKMAAEAGIYECMWRPDEYGFDRAAQLIDPLRAGLAAMRSDPARFEALNPPNMWGDYHGLVRVASEYLAACEEHPMAIVRVSR